MKPIRLLLAALLLAQPLQAAFAADWQLVLSDRNRRVEIDRDSILSSDAGTRVGWGRVVLTTDEARRSGYAMIKALNRYDCRNNTFATIKRVYVDAFDNIVREESVEGEALSVARGSVDERMWREVCKPATAADLQQLASEAARVAAAPARAASSATPPAARLAAPAIAAAPTSPAAAPAPAALAAPAPAPPALAAPAPAAPVPVPTAESVSAAPPAPVVQIPAKFAAGAIRTADVSQEPQTSILPPLPRIVPPTAEVDKRAAQPVAARVPAPATPSASAAVPARVAAPKPPASPRPTAAPARPVRGEAPNVAPAAALTAAPQPTAPRPAVQAQARPQAQARTAAPTNEPRAAQATPSGIRITRLGQAEPGWSYDGDTGPEHWGRLRPEWRVCAEGSRQSPIDLRDGIAVELAPVVFDYRRSGFRVRDTGNTLQVEVGEGMGIEVRGTRYALERFTLHRPSQDRVGGMAHDMALYLEHRSEDGRVAMLSLLLEAGGARNEVLQTVFNNLPLDRGREFVPQAVLDLAALVPAQPGHFLYMGSLPTPPCSEDVLWVVMKQPLPIADEQLVVFSRLYPRNGRPIQPLNGRLLLESR
ncbi:surface-adhesin E family protein [Thauera sp.]|uniref:carbonic anhydrase n=1 Tax=Thauera sp. TaxID=1905334 RepID=UPI002CF1B677|nr:surface-adhesin E family protein [Thauera sp.]HRP22935.1 carbonic anhydrase family protein [Thauera sp.]